MEGSSSSHLFGGNSEAPEDNMGFSKLIPTSSITEKISEMYNEMSKKNGMGLVNSYSEITSDFIKDFLKAQNLKLIYLCNPGSNTKNIYAELENLHLGKIFMDVEPTASNTPNFTQNSRYVWVVQSSKFLRNLTQRRIVLPDTDFLIFEEDSYPSDTNNPLNAIFNTFYTIQLISGEKNLPRVFLIDNSWSGIQLETKETNAQEEADNIEPVEEPQIDEGEIDSCSEPKAGTKIGLKPSQLRRMSFIETHKDICSVFLSIFIHLNTIKPRKQYRRI